MHKVTIKPLAGKLEFYFSHVFQGSIWNMVLVPGRSVLALEVRNDERRRVVFSALDFKKNHFLWREVQMGEPWWINLYMAKENEVILRKFENTNNPDSISFVGLDLLTASVVEGSRPPEALDKKGQNGEVIVPAQYPQGSEYFETVKKFVQRKLNRIPVHTIEYLENAGLVFISLYFKEDADLENHLLVFDEEGELLLQEKMGWGLKGLGLETFFIQSQYLFYVKNKIELVTYRIV